VTPPRVGVNLLWLVPGAAGGAEEYALRLLRALADVGRDELDLTLLCNRRFPAAHPDLVDRFPTLVAPIDGASRLVRIAAESTWLPAVASRAGVGLVHHLNTVVPWVRNRPSVVTVHDLRPIELPNTIGRVQGSYLRMRLPPAARSTGVITTPSRFVRETVIRRLGADPERVLVVSAPLPANQEGLPPAGPPGRPTFLYPAITNPHKNHRTLLDAFAKVIAARDDAVLVLTGSPGAAEGSVRRAIMELGLSRSVRRAGRVSAEELDGLFRRSVALVYPSTYEGFGLPLAEAMAVGCPVIASDRTALPEVVDGAGVLLDPYDTRAWAEAMLRLLDDDHERAALIAAGLERARSFTPEEAVRQQMAAYRLALEGPRRRAAS
jgi:glycosyltransferase involved in cell wall biosynthesis